MSRLPPNFSDRLLKSLLAIPVMQNQNNRSMLLNHLPEGPVSAIARDPAPYADLNNIIISAKGWGQLADSGELALAIIARNALPFTEGTELQYKIDALLSELENLTPSAAPEHLPEIIKPIRILHLSDIHLENSDQARIYRAQLETDLIKNLGINDLRYLVISGDIVNHAKEIEYEAAFEFLNEIIERFGLDVARIIIVPGNHDSSWDASKEAYKLIPKDKLPKKIPKETYISAGKIGKRLRDEDLYQQRFANYSSILYKQVHNGTEYPLNYHEQAILIEQPEDRILFLALNSSWQVDHHYKNRASINMVALSNALDHLQNGAHDGWLKIAVWHHPITGKEMMSDDFMQLLAVHGFQICMHGHIHEAIESYHKYDDKRGIFRIGAGTFGAPVKEQVTGIPLQYNLITIDPEKGGILVNTRKKEKPSGVWEADARWGDKNDPKSWYYFKVKNYVAPNKV